jgi:hypothetical protein
VGIFKNKNTQKKVRRNSNKTSTLYPSKHSKPSYSSEKKNIDKEKQLHSGHQLTTLSSFLLIFPP